MWMRTKKIIASLYGKRLELVDDTLFEGITFWPDFTSYVFGPKDIPPEAQWVTGPTLYYSITLTGKVKFDGGVKTHRFTWDAVELQEDCLLVKCGFHAKSCRYFFRPTKRFLVKPEFTILSTA